MQEYSFLVNVSVEDMKDSFNTFIQRAAYTLFGYNYYLRLCIAYRVLMSPTTQLPEPFAIIPCSQIRQSISIQ